MGGKKTVEKSREWEKERRDKLNVGFNDLYKLLPDHDPSIALSKMDILRKAAEYIRLLQDQNEEIIKSGDNDVLRNEAERLKKRVAYLLLKTKELVTALRAAGVPVPNSKKKKKKKSKAQTVVKDQNHSPLTSGANTVQRVPCALVLGSGGKPSVNIAAAAPLPGKKVKCGCEKAAKKNPLSELNCASAPTTSGHPVACHVTVVPSISQSTPTIIGAPVQASIQALPPTLGPGTLIFRDGRVVTVPPAASVIPQILVKPQPTFIVMQRAPVVSAKRDKVPLIAPKRREITQTTFSNKAPIPAIKTFRLESYPRPYKPKGKKKIVTNTDDSSAALNNKTPTSEKAGNSASVSILSTEVTPISSESPSASKLKRKAEPIVRKTKVAKPTSIHFLKPKTKPDASEETKKSETDLIQVDKTQKTGEDNSTPVKNDGNMGAIASKTTSNVTEGPGSRCLPQVGSPVIASSQAAASALMTLPSTHDTISAREDKRIPATDRMEIDLDIVEHSQKVRENQVKPNDIHEKILEDNAKISVPEGLLRIENLNVNRRTCLTSDPTNMVVQLTDSVKDVSAIESSEKANVLASKYPSQISHVCDGNKGPFIDETVVEKDAHHKDTDPCVVPSTLNRVESERGLTPERPQQQEISRNESNYNRPMNRSRSMEESRNIPSFSNTDLPDRSNFSMGGLGQFRSAHPSGTVSSSDNSMISNNYASQISHVSDDNKVPFIEKTVIEKDLCKDGNPGMFPSTLNRVEPDKGLTPEKHQQQEISRNEHGGNLSINRSRSMEESRNIPLFSNTHLPGRSNFSMGGLGQFCSAHPSSNASSSGNSTLSTPKTCAESLPTEACVVSSSISCSLAKPSGTLSYVKVSSYSRISNAVLPVSSQNVGAVPSRGFPRCGAVQDVRSAHPGDPSGSLNVNPPTPVGSASRMVAASSGSFCTSAIPSTFSNSPSSVPLGSGNSAASHTATPTCFVSSNSLLPVPTREAAASASCVAPLSIHSAQSKAVLTKSEVDSSVVGSSAQFSFEIASSTVSRPGTKSSVPTESINQTAPQKDLTQRSSEMDSESRAVHKVDGVKKSLTHQNEPFALQGSSKQLKDVQCSKSAASLANCSIAPSVGASQKNSHAEPLCRANNSNQLAFRSTSSIQPNVSTALSNTGVTPSLTASGQVYTFGIPAVPTEPCRSESFFNYDNPIATIPSDPFFSNFKPGEMPVSCAASTGLGYSTFTTQAPPVRSVARQLFPADPLSSISNSYNLDANLPPLNSSTGQMFQFSSYSNTNSFRDPLLFPNDFLSTPTKTTVALESLPHEKEPPVNSSHNFPDLLHPTTSMNSLANVPCTFGVGQMPPTSSTYVSYDFRTSTDQPNRKQYQVVDQPTFNTKRIPKSGSDGNFSMNVITSSSDLRMQDTRNPSNSDYTKPVATMQNFSFPYLNTSQSLTPQMTLDGFNFNIRDPAEQSQNVPSRDLILHSHPSSRSLADKNYQKTSNQGMNPQKSSVPKEFCINTSGASSSSARGQCVQANVFHADATNVYQGTSTKSTQGTNNFRACGNNSQSSSQGVQTQQSYLCNSNSQQALNKLVPPSGSQSFTCSSQADQTHLNHYDKKYPKSGQDSLYGVPENHMKVSGSQTSKPDCSLTVRTHKNYQPATSLPHSCLTTSSHNMNFSSSAMFSHANTNRSMQAPVVSSYSGASGATLPQSIYSHPTTAASSQGYSHVGDGSRNSQQNLFRVSHMSANVFQPNPPQYQSKLCSSSSQIFSTVESLAQQNLNASHNRKPLNNNGNQMPSRQVDQSDVNVFGGMGAPQNHPNQKDSQTELMTTFSMSSITGYPSHSVPSESMGTSNSNQNPTYSRVQNTKQITSVNKVTQQYPPSSTNSVPPAKHCDYPLSSILTGLNDTMLNTVGTSEAQLSSKAAANTTSSGKPPCNDKVVHKQYSTNTEGGSFKAAENTPCNADYLRSKENERNFIPIMEDVRLNSEFSNDLFSSLQVPTGGAHADSISPTAAFLLAFPLVSTSKNSENPHESDPQDNNASTPTTILQIGNIEPSSSEMFQPLEFGKDIEASEYLGQLPDKCKRKDVSGKQKKPNAVYNSYSYPSMSGDYNVHYDQSWTDQSKSKGGEVRKKSDKQGKFCGNDYELCKDKSKKKSKISVNWMAAPDVETFQKEQEASSFQANLSFPMDIDALPDLCSSKKNAYSWSPSKSLLPLDSGLVIPSTLPTLVGDLALGTPTPADTYKRCDNSKKQDKSPEKQNLQKSQSNFLSVSQLVDPKSKKKLPDKCKKTDKKKTATCQKRKDAGSGLPSEPCMYSDGFLPPLGWDKYRYRNNYSAEALIASQDVNESANFTYQQNPNYFVGSELNQEHNQQSQQYQNSFNFPQNQFPPFSAEEYQNAGFSINSAQSSNSKRGGTVDKRFREEASRLPAGGAATYQNHPPSLQPYTATPLPPSSVPPSSHPSNFTSNTTTSVTNFNLSTIFPEINERAGSQGQAGPSQQQQQQQQHGSQPLPHNNMSSFQNSSAPNNYRSHNL